MPTIFYILITISVSASLIVLFFFPNPKHIETAESILTAFILAMIVRCVLIQAFVIPSPSMQDTLMIGDNLIATKFNFLFRKPHRGEIIIFRSPHDSRKEFVKRLIGLPGDKIIIDGGKAWVNGKPLTNPSKHKVYTNMVSHVIPTIKGNHLSYNTRYAAYQKYFQGLGLKNQEFTVPDNSYFLLGDNTEQSSDSRYWGFVPTHLVDGRVLLIYWPFKRFKLIQ